MTLNEDKGVVMSKAHRGTGIRDQVRSGRGTCPVCKRSGIKLLYEVEAGEKKVMICKQCKTALSHGKHKEALAVL